MITFFQLSLAKLLGVINPLVMFPLFIGLTTPYSEAERHWAAKRVVIISMAVLVSFALVGQVMFDQMGISTAALQVGGGILLFRSALGMVSGNNGGSRDISSQNLPPISSLVVFPLAVPLTAGPGALSIIAIEMSSAKTTTAMIALLASVICVMAITYTTLVFSSFLAKLLGKELTDILGRVFGIVIAALSAQLVLQGLQQTFG